MITQRSTCDISQKSHWKIKYGNIINIIPVLQMTELIYFNFQRGNWKNWNFASPSLSPKPVANSSRVLWSQEGARLGLAMVTVMDWSLFSLSHGQRLQSITRIRKHTMPWLHTFETDLTGNEERTNTQEKSWGWVGNVFLQWASPAPQKLGASVICSCGGAVSLQWSRRRKLWSIYTANICRTTGRPCYPQGSEALCTWLTWLY